MSQRWWRTGLFGAVLVLGLAMVAASITVPIILLLRANDRTLNRWAEIGTALSPVGIFFSGAAFIAILIDASIVLALLDPEDFLHAPASAAARHRRDAGDDFLPASVLAEVLVGAALRGDAELATRRALAAAAFGPPHPIDEEVAVATARWKARHRSLRLPDALVLATADVAGADGVLTGDKRWGPWIRGSR